MIDGSARKMRSILRSEQHELEPALWRGSQKEKKGKI